MLPKAYEPLQLLFEIIHENPDVFKDIEIHFIGTGKTPNDPVGYNIKPYAEKYGLWETQVFEYPKRIPYLDVLVHLENSDGVFILGSTEPHYTPSKTYQGVLSEKPIFAMLHSASTAAEVLESSYAGKVFKIKPDSLDEQKEELLSCFIEFLEFRDTFSSSNVDLNQFEQYSAENVTSQLAKLLNEVTE
jgi:hypothetical protein